MESGTMQGARDEIHRSFTVNSLYDILTTNLEELKACEDIKTEKETKQSELPKVDVMML